MGFVYDFGPFWTLSICIQNLFNELCDARIVGHGDLRELIKTSEIRELVFD